MVVIYHHFFMGDWDEIYLSYGGYMYILLANRIKCIRIKIQKNVIIEDVA